MNTVLVLMVAVDFLMITGLMYRQALAERNFYNRLAAKELIIQELSEALVDAETPELGLLTEGSEWRLTMAPSNDETGGPLTGKRWGIAGRTT